MKMPSHGLPNGAQAKPNGKDLPTVCVLCSHNCGLRMDVEDGEVVSIRADEKNPITKGYGCHKAYQVGKYIRHEQRVETPLKKAPGGGFVPISWEQAFSEIGAKLKQIRKTSGKQSLALLGIGGQANHMDGPYAVSFMKAYGSPWIFNALAQEKTQHPLVDGWLMGAPATSYLHGDVENTAYVLVIGTNPVVSHRGSRPTEVIRDVRKNPEQTMVVVDPRRTETAKSADLHLAIRPGTDGAFLLGLCSHIVQKGLHDQAFLDAHATGVDRAFELLEAVDVADLAKRCELDHERLVEVAEGFAKAKSATVFWDLGIEQAPYSTLNAYLLRLMLILTGNLCKPGGAFFLPTLLPAMPYREKAPFKATVSSIPAISIFGNTGYFSPNLFAEEVLEGAIPIRAAIVEGSNPMLQFADTKAVRKAFEALELLVVIEPAMTESAQLADYVLPTPVGYEKWEWALFPRGFPEVTAQLRPPVVPQQGDGLPEAEIYYQVAKAAGIIMPAPKALKALAKNVSPRKLGLPFLGAVMALSSRSGNSANRMFWFYELVGPHLPSKALAAVWGLCHVMAQARTEDVQRTFGKGLKGFALGERIFDALLEHPEGLEVARVDEASNLADHSRLSGGKIRLSPEVMMREIEVLLEDSFSMPEGFPLLLQAGKRTRWTANAILRDPTWRKTKKDPCPLTVHPEDAAAFGLEEGGRARVRSAAGEVDVAVELDAAQRRGHVSLPNGMGNRYPDKDGKAAFVGININELTSARARDPFTGIPHHKYVPVAVEPLPSAAAE